MAPPTASSILSTCFPTQPGLLLETSRLQSLFYNILMVAFLVALATIALFQFIKPVARSLIYRQAIDRWAAQLQRQGKTGLNSWNEARPQWLQRIRPRPILIGSALNREADSAERHPWSKAVTSTALPYVMREVQNRASKIIESPSESPALFLGLTEQASPDDQHTLIWFDSLRRSNEKLFARLTAEAVADDPPEKTSSPTRDAARVVVAAQQAVAAAVEKKLDGLQLALAVRWAFAGRCFALLLGVVLAVVAALSINAGSPLTLLIGLAGGALASLLHDAGTRLAGASRR